MPSRGDDAAASGPPAVRVIDEYELFAPTGRRYVFRRRARAERMREGAEVAALLVLSGALHVLYLGPLWRLLVRP